MKTINVETKEQLDMLYDNSALTIEGLTKESIPDFIEWIKKRSEMTDETVYIISGKMMNESYNLNGNNAYKDNLTIVSIPLNQIKNTSKFISDRFAVGARWFDDIVDNNRRRERETNL